MDGIGGMHAWQWFMLIEGALSIFVAILAYFLLPNWANNTPWLLPEETEMAQYRLVLSAGGIDEADSKLSMWDGAKLAVKDWFTWLFMLLHFFLIAAQSFKDFLPSIVSDIPSNMQRSRTDTSAQDNEFLKLDDLPPPVPLLPPRIPRYPWFRMEFRKVQGFSLACRKFHHILVLCHR